MGSNYPQNFICFKLIMLCSPFGDTKKGRADSHHKQEYIFHDGAVPIGIIYVTLNVDLELSKSDTNLHVKIKY
jgi:hypothetical protein